MAFHKTKWSQSQMIRIDHFLLRVLLGRRWKSKLWMSKRDKIQLETLIHVRSAPVLVKEHGLASMKLSVDGPFPCFNPSIVSVPGGYLVSARCTNLINLNDGHYFIQKNSGLQDSFNYLLSLDSDFKITGQRKINHDALAGEGKAAEFGIEDLRLFTWRGVIWACGSGVHQGPRAGSKEVHPILARLEGDHLVDAVSLPSPYQRSIEKNWAPIVHDDELFFAYNISPFEVFHYSQGKLSLKVKPEKPFEHDFNLRGGTPFIPWKGFFLGLVHSTQLSYLNKLYYTHNFVLVDVDLNVVETSEPFFIERKGIEFVAGLQAIEEAIVITYGVADRVCKLLKIPNSVIEQYFTMP